MERDDNVAKCRDIISPEAILDCLKNPERRFILRYLRENEIADVDTLAREIVAWDDDTAPTEGDRNRRIAVETELVHVQLPKLAERHFVAYDGRSGAVRYGDPPDLVERVLDALSGYDSFPTA